MDQHAGEQNLFKPGDGDNTAMQPVADAATVQAPTTPPIAAPSLPQPADNTITWTASEFVAHKKTMNWYLGLVVVMILVATAVWFIAKDLFLTATITAGVIIFGVYAGRNPREQTYSVDGDGLSIGERRYAFREFGSFSVAQEGPLLNIEFAPMKRFSVPVSIYIQSADEEKIVNMLSQHLPVTQPRNDLTDQLMRRIKF